jgi:Flp pilus assembly protein TadD
MALAQPQDVWADSSATVVAVQGKVEANIQTRGWQAANVNDELGSGDEIKTWEGKSTLLMSDESMLKLNRNTYLQLQGVGQTASWQSGSGVLNATAQTVKSIYRLFSGNAWLRNNNRQVDVEVQTPTVTASLRGTELNIEIVSNELVNITVLEGAVEARNSSGSVTAFAGELIIAPLGQIPRKQTLLSPEDSVQWTVRIPNLIDDNDWLLANATSSEQRTIETLFNDLGEQNISAAQQTLQSLQGASNNDYANLAALIEMTAGNHEGARAMFAAASEQDDQNVVAYRGLAISSLLVNKKSAAQQAAEKAIELRNGQNAVDWLVLSAIQRASFNLQAAEVSAHKALEGDPENVLALTNLGLLQFADDRISQAKGSVQKALAIDSQDSLAHSLLGFIQLSERDQIGASSSFTKAKALDPSNSESYLGASLLAQRLGQTKEAQKSLATAIALEPQRSLYLSYWAKALHQERRFDKALTVLDSAARLDSQDPTPHYYRAIIERDLFKAGEAISSLEKAIALNDKRAVYRSRLLLDQDLATRNVNLATIYGALGMNLLATQKAIDSTLNDFRNFSAHLFLSSALSSTGRDFPASSEVLVSGLLLPANANSLSSINDYTVFFEGPELDSNIQLVAGNNGTFGATANLAGVAPDLNLSYGVLASTAETDGWAGDNGGDLSSLAGTVKWQANQKDSFRARVSLSESQQLGGSFNRFDIDRTANDEVLDSEDRLLDLGYRRELSHRSDLLVNLILRKTEFDITGSNLFASPPPDVSLLFQEQTRAQRDTVQLQAQYSSRIGAHQLFTGAIHLDGSNKSDFTQTTRLSDQLGNPFNASPEIQAILDDGDRLASSVGDISRDTRFTSLYIDDIWQVSENLTLQMGAYYEDFDDEITQEAGLNPRLAVVWKPTATDTIRLAGFRYILPQVQARLHPTHAGGVFITRNTEEGARVEEFNIVWERSWEGGIFSANAFDLNRENRENRDFSIGETLERSSLQGASIGINQQIGKRFAVAAGVSLSEIRDDFSLLQTARDEVNAAITLSYVSPRRFTASLSQLYRRINFFESNRATQSIPLTDIGVSYTFANRRGGVALAVTNLFDEQFNWITDAFRVDGRDPARAVRGSVSWNF